TTTDGSARAAGARGQQTSGRGAPRAALHIRPAQDRGSSLPTHASRADRTRPRTRTAAATRGARTRAFSKAEALDRNPPAELSHDVVHGVADRLQVFEIFVLDAEADRSFTELLLERFDQLDERQRIGFEVVGERVALVDARGFDLEDVGQAIADEVEHLLAA